MTAPAIRLSICIPTYNFGAFIGETLKSIVDQIEDGVEIDILDGGSTDDTAEIVTQWQRRCPALRYHRQFERGGIDRDMARVVELSRGRYFWLFSADDIMVDGAILRILREIEGGHDIYLCAHEEWSFDLKATGERHPGLALAGDAEFDFSKAEDRARYFDAARTTAAFFSFLGSLVVRRELWSSVPLEESFVGSCWAHAVRLLNLLKRGMRLKYIHDPLLGRRYGNDSFLDRGIVHRCAIGIEGYHRVAAHVFGFASPEAKAIRRVVLREFPLPYLLLVKYQASRDPREDSARLHRLAAMAFVDPTPKNLLSRTFYKLMPARLFPATRAVWQGVRPGLDWVLGRSA